MISKSLILLLWVFFVHAAGIYLFTNGFLLSRLSLSERSVCSADPKTCSLPPTHSRAVFLVIDALRFDFLSPNPPKPSSPHHHNVLTLPAELTASFPQHSLLFNAYADPPTTTLQRIKGLTTGSLPTFVDIGSNFGGSSIVEDSIVQQLTDAGKKVAFMGDDTWTTVFPESFERNMTYGYDSFNVEDLHTVDEGVVEHLFPLLRDPSKPFDFLIGHFLGVDHVGHRMGPDHPTMQAKLRQMNDILTGVVDLLDESTILVVLGDHGMDKSGDHGGDGELETSSGLWIYSKGRPLSGSTRHIPSSLLPNTTFPGADTPHRKVQQIDLLPTLSLLLGLPIPFNNLGTVIPEFFTGKGQLSKALLLNAGQVRKYLQTYRGSASSSELDDAWPDLLSAWTTTQIQSNKDDAKLVAFYDYIRLALSTCRALWAQFNAILIFMGLSLLVTHIVATWALYHSLANAKGDWEVSLDVALYRCLRALATGAVLGVLAYLSLETYLPGIDALDCVLFAGPFMSCIAFIFSSMSSIPSAATLIAMLVSLPLPLILHSVSFLSNSFILWEDRLILLLLVGSLVPAVRTGFAAPTLRLRKRILGFAATFAVCVRLMALSTVCREEQQPYCNVTFFASSSLPSPPLPILILALLAALMLPYIIKRFLRISMSDRGLASPFLQWILPASLVLGTSYWVMEWADSAGQLDDSWTGILRNGRTAVARLAIGIAAFAGVTLWWLVPMCMEIVVKDVSESTKGTSAPQKQVTVIGFANAFGAPYLIFWSISLAMVYATTQLTGQVVLVLSTIALISYLEIVDSVRDVRALDAAFASSTPSTLLDLSASAASAPALSFADVAPLALLGLHTFYATGHQATISSIQWKTAFLLTPEVVYPWAPMTVILNSFGAVFLAGLAAPLLSLWNKAPGSTPPRSATPVPPNKKKVDPKQAQPSQHPGFHVQNDTLRSGLAIMLYYSMLLLGTAISAAVLRRHLMVWKVFAPRFMTAGVSLLAVDVGVLFGMGVGVARIMARVGEIFGGALNKAS